MCVVYASSISLTVGIENYLIQYPKLGVLHKPVSALVLHFGEYSSKQAFRPCEAAYLASPHAEFTSAPCVRAVTVLVAPSNYLNLRSSYSKIPNVTVKPLKLRSQDLTISSMLTMMSVDTSESPPLYMAQVTKLLRVMATESTAPFDYNLFRRKLNTLDFSPSQSAMLAQRIDLLESFLDLSPRRDDSGCFSPLPPLTIVDLSCPFVDESAACVLFNICIGLFLANSPPEVPKLLAVDEAHKYLKSGIPASKILTDRLLGIIRQQRHFGARIIIATQEPMVDPRLLDLASVTVVHRFSSPEWFEMLRRHLSGFRRAEGDVGEEGKREREAGLYRRIVALGTGEALVFAPGAWVVGGGSAAWGADAGAPVGRRTDDESFMIKVRRRITADGGQSIMCL